MAQLNIALTLAQERVQIGDTVPLTVEIRNTGTTTATSPTVIIELPAGLSYDPVASDLRWQSRALLQNEDSTLIQVELAALPPDSIQQLTIQLRTSSRTPRDKPLIIKGQVNWNNGSTNATTKLVVELRRVYIPLVMRQ